MLPAPWLCPAEVAELCCGNSARRRRAAGAAGCGAHGRKRWGWRSGPRLGWFLPPCRSGHSAALTALPGCIPRPKAQGPCTPPPPSQGRIHREVQLSISVPHVLEPRQGRCMCPKQQPALPRRPGGFRSGWAQALQLGSRTGFRLLLDRPTPERETLWTYSLGPPSPHNPCHHYSIFCSDTALGTGEPVSLCIYDIQSFFE